MTQNRALIQTLEPRTLYAFTNPVATVTLTDGVLSIVGTAVKDTITVDWGASDASLVKVTTVTGRKTNFYTFQTANISTINILAGAGSDTINVSSMTFSSTVVGGAGNDTIYGSLAGGSLFGGAGKDTLYTYGGVTTVDPGPGSDLYQILPGDIYTGSRGKDRLLD